MNSIKKMCILYDGRICNNCGECEKCDLDSNKICDNCGKCLDKMQNDSEFRSINVVAETENEKSEVDQYEESAIRAFLDEPLDLFDVEPLNVDPLLAEEWEKILADSFKADREKERLANDEPPLRAIRKRREHSK